MEEEEREGSGKVLHATRPLERVERGEGGLAGKPESSGKELIE